MLFVLDDLVRVALVGSPDVGDISHPLGSLRRVNRLSHIAVARRHGC